MVSESSGVGVGVTFGVGVGVIEDPVKVIVGLLLPASVTVKLLVVSLIKSVSVPAFCELTVKLAVPFCTEIVTGKEDPLTVRLESLEVWEIVRLSDETSLCPQSRILTLTVPDDPVWIEDGG